MELFRCGLCRHFRVEICTARPPQYEPAFRQHHPYDGSGDKFYGIGEWSYPQVYADMIACGCFKRRWFKTCACLYSLRCHVQLWFFCKKESFYRNLKLWVLFPKEQRDTINEARSKAVGKDKVFDILVDRGFLDSDTGCPTNLGWWCFAKDVDSPL